jgi:hypothetical protein
MSNHLLSQAYQLSSHWGGGGLSLESSNLTDALRPYADMSHNGYSSIANGLYYVEICTGRFDFHHLYARLGYESAGVLQGLSFSKLI